MAGLKKSIGASAADVGVRLVAQMASTVVIARLLPAEDFGIALMVLSVVAVLGNFVSLPFEEALTQRPKLTTHHLEAALWVSLVLTAASVVIMAGVAPILAYLSGVPELTIWLPVATLFLIGNGPGAISRAIYRRHHRFVDLAASQSASVVLSSILSIAVAYAGWGILALILQRMLPVVLFPILAVGISWRAGETMLIRPRLHVQRFRELLRFSWLYLADVTVDYATPAIMTFVVNAHFGTTVLGQLNIAMRMVEPLRAAIAGVGHNLVFSILTRLQAQPQQLVRAGAEIVANVSGVAVAAFFGLLVSAPLLLPVLVGPGWDSAVPMSRALCVAAAISIPFRYYYSGFSALGKPEYGLYGSTLGLIVMLVWLEIAAVWDRPDLVGWAIVASEAATALLGLAFAVPLAGRGLIGPLVRVARVWIAAGLMVLLLDMLLVRDPFLEPRSLALLATIIAGVLVYPVFLFVVCRPCFQTLYRTILSRKRGET